MTLWLSNIVSRGNKNEKWPLMCVGCHGSFCRLCNCPPVVSLEMSDFTLKGIFLGIKAGKTQISMHCMLSEPSLST